jgi:hypothetical protein
VAKVEECGRKAMFDVPKITDVRRQRSSAMFACILVHNISRAQKTLFGNPMVSKTQAQVWM